MISGYKIEKEKGSALVMVLIIFVVMSLLGTAILATTTSENKITRIDSRSQSTYYVAESGIQYILSNINNEIEAMRKDHPSEEEFFQVFESEFIGKEYYFNGFEVNFGEQPAAKISIRLENSGAGFRDYRIESTGNIGGSKRTVSSVITLGVVEPTASPIIDNLLFYTEDFVFGGNNMYGAGNTSVSDGIKTHHLNGGAGVYISTMYFNGPVSFDDGSASFGSQSNPGTIYVNGSLDLWNGTRNVYGDIRVKGNFRLKDARIHGNVYVNGNLELGWTPEIIKKIYYTGNIVYPDNYNQALLNKCIKVESVDPWEIPVRNMSLRDNGWYTNNGYEIKGNVTSTVTKNAKWLVNNYEHTDWQSIEGNIVIVSKGDIKINIGNSFTGALIAPNGTVEVTNGGTTFNGVVVSKKGIIFSGGGNTINLKKLQEVFSVDKIPLIFAAQGGGSSGGGSGSTGSVQLAVKSGIKEK